MYGFVCVYLACVNVCVRVYVCQHINVHMSACEYLLVCLWVSWYIVQLKRKETSTDNAHHPGIKKEMKIWVNKRGRRPCFDVNKHRNSKQMCGVSTLRSLMFSALVLRILWHWVMSSIHTRCRILLVLCQIRATLSFFYFISF